MRMVLLLAIAVMAVVPPCAGQALSPAERQSLFAAREAVWRAYFEGDSARLVQLLPERMVAMGKHRDDIIRDAQAFRSGGGKFLGITFSDDEVLIKGTMAVVWSRYRVQTTTNGEPHVMAGIATEIFVLENGRWINPYWHLHDDH